MGDSSPMQGSPAQTPTSSDCRPPQGAQPELLAGAPFTEHQGHASPDSRFIAYATDETGRPDVWVQALPPAKGRWQVSVGGGAQPMWRRDGRELFYLGLDDTLMAVPSRLRSPSRRARPNDSSRSGWTNRRSRPFGITTPSQATASGSWSTASEPARELT